DVPPPGAAGAVDGGSAVVNSDCTGLVPSDLGASVTAKLDVPATGFCTVARPDDVTGTVPVGLLPDMQTAPAWHFLDSATGAETSVVDSAAKILELYSQPSGFSGIAFPAGQSLEGEHLASIDHAGVVRRVAS